MKMRYKVVAVVVVVLGVCIFFGASKVWSNVKAWSERAKDGVDAVNSDDQEATRIRILMADADKEVAKCEDFLTDLVDQKKLNEGKLRRAEASLKLHEEILQKEKTLLTGPGPYTVKGAEYTKDQVSHDAKVRLAVCNTLQGEIAGLNSIIDQMRLGESVSREKLASVRVLQGEMTTKLSLLESRLASARAVGHLNTFSSADVLSSSSELNRAVQNFERRVKAAERRAAIDPVGQSGLIVDWEGKKQDAPVDTLIDNYFKGSSTQGKEASAPNVSVGIVEGH